jgi:hypothetical protein
LNRNIEGYGGYVDLRRAQAQRWIWANFNDIIDIILLPHPSFVDNYYDIILLPHPSFVNNYYNIF